jgi:hypothetical protein
MIIKFCKYYDKNTQRCVHKDNTDIDSRHPKLCLDKYCPLNKEKVEYEK